MTDTPEEPNQNIIHLNAPSTEHSEPDAMPEFTAAPQFTEEPPKSSKTWIRWCLVGTVAIIVIGAGAGGYYLYKRSFAPLLSPPIVMNTVSSDVEPLAPPVIAISDSSSATRVEPEPVVYPVSAVQLVASSSADQQEEGLESLPTDIVDLPPIRVESTLNSVDVEPGLPIDERPFDYRLLEQGFTRLYSVSTEHDATLSAHELLIADLAQQIDELRRVQISFLSSGATAAAQPVAAPLPAATPEHVTRVPVKSVSVPSAPESDAPRVMSIKVFGSAVSVRAKVGGSTRSMAVGETLDGWILKSTDMESGIASFTHLSGRQEDVYL